MYQQPDDNVSSSIQQKQMKLREIEVCFGIILLVLTINAQYHSLPSDTFCPNEVPVTTNCYNTTCPGDEICYEAKTVNVCCPKNPSFCKLTGMYSYFDQREQGSAQIFQYKFTTSKLQFFYDINDFKTEFLRACPWPPSVLFIEKFKSSSKIKVRGSMLPVDLEWVYQENALKRCEKNSDCPEDTFCGDTYNDSNNGTFDGRDEQNIKFCYRIPPVPVPYNTTTKYIKLPDKHSLLTCDSHEECYNQSRDGSSFCNKKHGYNKLTYFVKNGDVYEKKFKEGLCMTSKICVDANKPAGVHNFKWDFAGAPYQSDHIDGCESDEKCEGGGNTRSSLNQANIIYNPLCIKDKAMNGMSVCCYESISQCNPGITATPPISCNETDLTDGETNFEKCNGKFEILKEQQTPASRWCDDNTKICCKHIQNTVQWCDDGDTPLFNEPTCTEYDPSIITSGYCEQKGATCKYGHCCPKVTIDLITNNKTIPEYTYSTRYPCIPGERPPLFNMGFCDPKTGKVVILGEKSSKTGEPLTYFPRDAPMTCVKDIQCSYDNSTICLYKEIIGKCFYNPMLPLPPSSKAVWIGLLITSIILAFVFFPISIYIMYSYGPKALFGKSNENKEDAMKSSNVSKEGAKEMKSGVEDEQTKIWLVTPVMM